MHNTEIERKFLVTSDCFKSMAIRQFEIQQGYLCKDKERTIRVRIRDAHAFLTIKSTELSSGIARFEWEREIDLADARQLLSLCLPGVIEKTRYVVPATVPDPQPEQPLFWEVDEFHGRLEGLTLAELELPSEQQPYCKAAFVGEEVTGNPRYYNANM